MTNSKATIDPIVFYVVAHPDDWIYFTPSIFYDVQNAGKDKNNSGKLIIVYLTSGDAGRTDGWWQTREAGAKAATRLLASISSMRNSSPDDFDSTEWQSKDGRLYKFGVTKSYFLRVPDMQVQALLDGMPQTTVDNLMTYSNKEDL
jgi:hypothetical protein